VLGSVTPLHQISIVVLLNMTVVCTPSSTQYQTAVRSLENGGGGTCPPASVVTERALHTITRTIIETTTAAAAKHGYIMHTVVYKHLGYLRTCVAETATHSARCYTQITANINVQRRILYAI